MGWYPGKFLGLVPRPQYATHGTSFESAEVILKEGVIKRSEVEKSVSLSLDWSEWGKMWFLFPFDQIKPITRPVFYADIFTPVVYFTKFRISAWYGLELKEVYSEVDIPLSLVKSVIITDVRGTSRLAPLIEKRGLSVLSAPPDTPLFRWGEEVRRLCKAGEIDEILRMAEAYNRMIAAVYNIDYREVEETIKKTEITVF